MLYQNIIEWEEQKHGVGVEEFDEHHKRLISLVNDLHKAMREKKGKEQVKKTLESLVEYADYHFSAEEDTLKELNCPQYQEQKEAHDALLNQVYSLQKDLENGKVFISLETMDFLKHWVEDHIMGLDSKYATCICAKRK